MDVRCEKCQTVYEFDDAKVTEAGVTVKCTQCGNLFKVRKRPVTASNLGSMATIPPPPAPSSLPPERQRTSTLPRGSNLAPTPTPPAQRPPTPRGVPAVPTPPTAEERVWLVRITSSGEVKRFRELTTLQQWIVEKRVNREDEISRSGDTWKRLGGIAELASFFHIVEQAEAKAQAEAAAHENPALTTTERMTAPQRPMRNAPGLDVSGPVPVVPQVQRGERAFANTAPAMRPLDSPLPGAEYGHSAPDDDELDEMPSSRPGGKKMILIGAGALVAVLGLVGIVKRDAVKSMFGGGDGRGGEAYKKGREYFLLDSDDSLRLADQQLQRAHGAEESSALPVAALAELNAVWAGYLRDDAKLAEAAKQPARAEEMRKSAQAHLDDAKRYANEATTLAADDPDVNRAMAQFLLIDGAPAPQVEGFLKRCEDKRPDDPDTAFVRGALLQREGRMAESRTRLEQANQLNHAKTQLDLLRADFLLASIAAQQGRKEEAKVLAQKVLDINSHHERARALIAGLEAPPPAAADAGSAPAAPVPAPAAPVAAVPGAPAAPAPGAPVAPAPPGKGKPGEPLEPKGGGSFDSILTQANKLLENGRGKEAQKLFEKALTMQPTNVEALNGLGYCYLDTEHFNAAIDKFKQAMQTAPSNGDAIIGIAEAYKMRGDKPHALEYYKKYAETLPGGSKIRMAQTNIRDIEEALKRSAPPPAPTPAAPEPSKDTPPPPPP